MKFGEVKTQEQNYLVFPPIPPTRRNFPCTILPDPVFFIFTFLDTIVLAGCGKSPPAPRTVARDARDVREWRNVVRLDSPSSRPSASLAWLSCREPDRHCLADEAKEVRPDARPQAQENRRCTRWNPWNTLRILRTENDTDGRGSFAAVEERSISDGLLTQAQFP